MLFRSYRSQQADGSVIDTVHRQYYINDVTIVTDYDPLSFESLTHRRPDTVRVDGVDIVYLNGKKTVRPKVLERNNFIIPGKLFNERNVEQTYASYATLRSLRNVNIRFSEIEQNDTMKLNCTILTSPADRKSVG